MTELKQYRIKAASAAELVREHRGGCRQRRARPRAAAALRAAPRRRGRPQPGHRRRRARRAAPAGGGADRAAARHAHRRGPADRLHAGAAAGPARRPRPLARQPRPGAAPRPASARCARSTLPVRLYGEPQALPELLELAREQLRADGIPGESLCVVSGALDGIERVLQAHLRPGDRVAVENPGYAALFDLLRARGLSLEPVAVDDRGMLPGELQRRPRARRRRRRSSRPAGRTRRARRSTPGARAELRDVLAASPDDARDRGRPPRAGRRQRAAHAPRRRPRDALGGHPLGGQGARARPAPRAARRRRPHDRPRAGAPAVRARMGQPHPADARARPVDRSRRAGAHRPRERHLRRSAASACSTCLARVGRRARTAPPA